MVGALELLELDGVHVRLDVELLPVGQRHRVAAHELLDVVDLHRPERDLFSLDHGRRRRLGRLRLRDAAHDLRPLDRRLVDALEGGVDRHHRLFAHAAQYVREAVASREAARALHQHPVGILLPGPALRPQPGLLRLADRERRGPRAFAVGAPERDDGHRVVLLQVGGDEELAALVADHVVLVVVGVLARRHHHGEQSVAPERRPPVGDEHAVQRGHRRQADLHAVLDGDEHVSRPAAVALRHELARGDELRQPPRLVDVARGLAHRHVRARRRGRRGRREAERRFALCDLFGGLRVDFRINGGGGCRCDVLSGLRLCHLAPQVFRNGTARGCRRRSACRSTAHRPTPRRPRPARRSRHAPRRS